MRKSIVILIIIGTSLIADVGWAQHNQQKTLPLIPMMQMLLNDMQQVDRGIYTKDFDLIARGAGAIADHPKMTKQDKKLIKKVLGKEIKQFVKFDMIVHHNADSMRMAAEHKDMQEVLDHYRIVQQGCVDCHSNYRDRILKARKDN